MRVAYLVVTAPVLTAGFLAPHGALAQSPVPGVDLARARPLLELARGGMTAEQWALLSGKLAEAERARAVLASLTAPGGEATAAVLAESGAGVSSGATSAGARAVGMAAVEALPLLLLLWPSTAHAPGVTHPAPANKESEPTIRDAAIKLDESLKALENAARKIEQELATASRTSKGPRTNSRCLPCAGPLPPARIDGDHAHHPCPGEHVHYYVWEQDPRTCQCFVKDRLACL